MALMVRGGDKTSDGSDDTVPLASVTAEATGEKLAVVLGAGFSRAVYGDFPLTDDLGEEVRRRLPAESQRKMPSQFSNGRFEDWLSYLSEAQPHWSRSDKAEASALAQRVLDLIGEVLAEHQQEALEEAPDWFWAFLSVLHVKRARVLSLNYDNLIECGVHTLGFPAHDQLGVPSSPICEDDVLGGLPPCAAFPGVSSQRVEPTSYAGDPLPVSERRNSTFRLYKLHGSLSWYWLPGTPGSQTLRRWRLPGLFGQLWDLEDELRREKLPGHERFIVPPATLKFERLGEPAVQEIWSQGAASVRQADRLVLMGYSIPVADHSVIGMLTDGIGGRDVQVEIVNPRYADVRDRLVRLGVSRASISTFGGRNCVQRWVATQVRAMSAEAIRALKQEPLLSEESVLFGDGPHLGRFSKIGLDNRRNKSIILTLSRQEEHNVNPVKGPALAGLLGRAQSCKIESGRRQLSVIGHWGKEHQPGTMAQVHLVPAGR